jgi:hypothetical protein
MSRTCPRFLRSEVEKCQGHIERMSDAPIENVKRPRPRFYLAAVAPPSHRRRTGVYGYVEEQPDDGSENPPRGGSITGDIPDYIEGGGPWQEDQSGHREDPTVAEGTFDPVGDQPQKHDRKTGTDPQEDQKQTTHPISSL